MFIRITTGGTLIVKKRNFSTMVNYTLFNVNKSKIKGNIKI